MSTTRRTVWAALVALALLSGGCTGVLEVPSTGDGSVSLDGQLPGPDGSVGAVCDDVDCSGFGDCVDVGAVAACSCDPGYHAEGLSCVEDQPPDPCDGVLCGANAGCEEGVCVCQSGYEGDPVAGCTPISTDEELARAELVTIALAELGYCEGTDDRPYMQAQPGYWCYDFVAWVYQQSSWSLPAPLSLQKHYVGALPTGWRPEPGDLIKFNIQHYGMVADIAPNGQTITTIEGNVSYCVMQRTITDLSVEYYGTLDPVF